MRDCIVDSIRAQTVIQCYSTRQSAPVVNLRIIGGRYTKAPDHVIVIGATFQVTGFEVSGALIEGQPTATLKYGLLVGAASQGIVNGNNVTGCSDFGIKESSPANNNLYIANRLVGNANGGLVFFWGVNTTALC